jgi:hypothetical protein
VPEQQHSPVICPYDSGHPDAEPGMHSPRQPPLERPGGPPGPDQQVGLAAPEDLSLLS